MREHRLPPRRPTTTCAVCAARAGSIILVACAALGACTHASVFPPAAPSTGKRPPPLERDFRGADMAKTDVDIVAETHARESLASVRLLMDKLYRRNPREWRKGPSSSMDAAIARAFDLDARFRFAELANARGSEAILLALKPDYGGDRVFAFGVGLASTVFLAYGEKLDFYMIDRLDAQKLYNSARNVEIAAWKLATSVDARGEPLLASNEASRDVRNLSFEREFGKIIGYQDVMAQIAAQRTNRTIRRVVQTMATAVFLPL